MSLGIDLAGRVAIVTGAGSRVPTGIGNGRAAAVLLARAGAQVVLVDEVAEWGSETADMIEREGGAASFVQSDVTSEEGCRKVVEEATRLWGRVDVLVNNVGVIGPRGTAETVNIDEWERAMRVNVTSMVLMSRYVVPLMRRDRGGSIVNLASITALMGGHASLFYPTSKAAVVGLTRAMAAHHGVDRIRVNAIAPGYAFTPMVYADGMTDEMRHQRRTSSLLNIEGTAWDVGNAVLWLASDLSRWVTGAVLVVDGGTTAATPTMPSPPGRDEIRPPLLNP